MQDSKRDTNVENGLLDSEGEGEGGMIWENGIETCILSCRNEAPVYVRYRIQDAWGWCTGMIQRERYEVGGGRGIQDWELVYTRVGLTSIYGKTNIVL